MTKKSVFLIYTIVASVFAFFLTSCEQNGYTTNLEPEKMFSIKYGNFEDETKLYSASV